MPTSADPGFNLRHRRMAQHLALAVSAAGVLVLLGWVFDIAALKSLLPGLATMKVNTAVLFVLCGASLWLAASPPSPGFSQWLGRMFAVIVGVVAAVTLGEYAFHWNAGMDQSLIPELVPGPGTPAPGRMALMTAVDFILLSAALLLIDVRSTSGRRPSNWLALVVASNAFLAVLGYVYGVTSLYRLAAFSSMALHTALIFIVACCAIALTRPASRFLRQVMRRNAAGLVNRRLLPAAIITPPFLGWVALQGEIADYYDAAFRLALFAMSNVAVFGTLVWWASGSIGRLHKAQRKVVETHDWQQAMINSANFIVISTDPEGVIRTINAGGATRLGYSPEELIGHFTPEVIHDKDEMAMRADALSDELDQPVRADFETFVAKARRGICDENDWTYIAKDGTRFPVRLSVTAILGVDGSVTGYLGIGYDITEQREAESKLRRMAQTDSLTGLANRGQFEERLGQTITQCETAGQSMALLFLDLDRFKAINDTFGHHGGDLALKEFAKRLRKFVRTSDTVARLAGDEFVIILWPLRDPDDAAHVANKIIDAMRLPFQLLDAGHPVSASIGVAVYHPGDTGEQLLRRADRELYKVKAAGRGHSSLGA